MLKLYGAPVTRSSFIQWYLQELNVPYEYVTLDYQAGKFNNPPADFLAVNPMGKTPAIADGEFKLWESGAILMYLAQKYGKLPDSLEERAIIEQWVFFASSTLGPYVLIDPNAFLQEGRDQALPRFFAPMNDILSQQSFIAGNELTAADITLLFDLLYTKEIIRYDFTPYPAILNYIQQLIERPAFKNTLGAEIQAMFS